MQNYELVAYLDNLLDNAKFKDVSYNGMQIEGQPKVKRILTATTASLRSIEKALEVGADTLLVHHGLFWKGANPCVAGALKERIKLILTHNLNLIAYHLPLDANFALGNNRYICDLIGGTKIEYITPGDPSSIAMRCCLQDVSTSQDLASILAGHLGNTIEIIGKDPLCKIKNIAVCSGSGSFVLDNCNHVTFDALITGDVNEQTYHLAFENNVVVFACGHHASEQGGIKQLGQKIEADLGLEVEHFSYPIETLSAFV